MEEEEISQSKEPLMSLRFKQTAKGEFIIDKAQVSGDTIQEIEERMNQLCQVAIARIKRVNPNISKELESLSRPTHIFIGMPEEGGDR